MKEIDIKTLCKDTFRYFFERIQHHSASHNDAEIDKHGRKRKISCMNQ